MSAPPADPALPGPPAGFVFPDHRLHGRRLSDEEVAAAYWGRPQPGRVPVPGDQLLYVHDFDGAGPPVDPTPVTVVGVDWANRQDPNVYDADGRVRADPAPLVTFRYGAVMVECRESRIPGTPGWTWPEG